MDTTQTIQNMIDKTLPDKIVERFQTPERLEVNENTVLGIAISQWADWNGARIMRVLSEALGDANFHTEAGIIDHIVKLLEDDKEDSVRALAEYVEAL